MTWIPPDEALAWSLAQGTCTWIDPRLARSAQAIEARLRALRAEVEDLEALRCRLQHEARAAAADEWRALRAELLDAERARARRAAEAAIDVAETLLQRSLDATPSDVRLLVERALRARESGPRPTRLRVAAGLGALVRAWLPSEPAPPDVLEDAELGLGDVIVEYPDGRQDGRLATLLAAALPAVEEELR